MSETRITEIEFDGIKNNLIQFYSGQDFWKDYNFQASGLNIMMDMLAFVTHYNLFYGNMQFAEGFLDSAQLRPQVASLASELLYVPKSIKAARSLVDIKLTPQINNVLPAQLILPKGSKFRGKGTNVQKDFVTTQSYTSNLSISGTHSFFDVALYEGNFASHEFVVNKNNKYQKFLLPNDNIDVDFLEIYVQEGSDDVNLNKYDRAIDIIALDENSRAYFINEGRDGRFEIQFGDGVLAKSIEHGKIIRAVYIETTGVSGNGADIVALISASDANFNANIIEFTASTTSAGASSKESTESIRFSAPKHFVSRGRAISLSDWETVIQQNFQGIKSVKAWGGEEEDIPFANFGQVFIAINPDDNTVLTETEKALIVSSSKAKFGTILVTPKVVDPDTLYLKLNVETFINILEAFVDIDTLKTNIAKVIKIYSSLSLERFNHDFEESTLTRQIWESDKKTIANTIIDITMEQRFVPRVGTIASYDFTMRNPIVPGSVSSNEVFVDFRNVFLEDDAKGNLRLFQITDTEKVITNNAAGTVDYENGTFKIFSINIQRANSDTFDWRVSAKPTSSHIKTRRNKILTVDLAQTKITASKITSNVNRTV